MADNTTCADVGNYISFMNSHGSDDVNTLIKACQTGIQMKSDGVSTAKFHKFIMNTVLADTDFSKQMRQDTAYAMTYGYQGSIDGNTVLMGTDIRNK